MRDGWEVAEAKAKDTELMFRRSEKQMLRIALKIANNLSDISLEVSDIDLRFTRRNYENISNKATVLTSMLANAKIHPKLAFQHCGLFPDAELAYKVSAEYAEEQEKKALELAKKQSTDGGNENDRKNNSDEKLD